MQVTRKKLGMSILATLGTVMLLFGSVGPAGATERTIVAMEPAGPPGENTVEGRVQPAQDAFAAPSDGESSSDEASVQATCAYLSVGDHVHISDTAPRAVQGHGWWTGNSACNGKKAKVTVTLQKNVGGSWVTVDESASTVYQGGGAGKRATARHDCSGTSSNAYRTLVDVDIVGEIDSPEKAVTDTIYMDCT